MTVILFSTRTAADVRSDIGAASATTSPVITLFGEISATATMTNLGNVAINCAIVDEVSIVKPTFTGDGVIITGTGSGASSVGYLRGPATFTIDPSGHADNTGTVVIAGNLQVDGITTTINSTTVAIDDKNLRLADTASTSSVLNGAGIELGFDPNSPTALASGALVDFLYVHADSRMVLSSAMKITGNLQDTTLADCIIDGGTF